MNSAVKHFRYDFLGLFRIITGKVTCVYRLREKGERKRKANKTFVFSCFIQLFSSFLFILKFIHFYLFSFFFFLTASITQLKKKKEKKMKITKNDFMLYNPPGGHS